MSPPGRARKLGALIHRFGWKPAFEIAWCWLLRQAFGYRAAIVYRLDLSALPADAACGGIRWSYMEPAAIAPALWRDADIQAPRPGDRCFVGISGNEQCYLSVVSGSGFHIPDRISVTFSASSESYVGNCVTLDAFRGMGIYPCGLAELGRRLRDEGRSWLYLFVERENLPSIRGVLKAGFRPAARCSVYVWRGRPIRRWRVLAALANPEAIGNWHVSAGN